MWEGKGEVNENTIYIIWNDIQAAPYEVRYIPSHAKKSLQKNVELND